MSEPWLPDGCKQDELDRSLDGDEPVNEGVCEVCGAAWDEPCLETCECSYCILIDTHDEEPPSPLDEPVNLELNEDDLLF